MDERETREALTAAALEAGPLRLRASELVDSLRRRRQTYRVAAAGAGVLLVLGTLSVLRLAIEGDPMQGAIDPAATPRYECGQRIDFTDLPDTFDGVTLSVAEVRMISTDAPPIVSMALSATRDVTVTTPPPTDIQILYLRDSVVVGGGPDLVSGVEQSATLRDLIGHATDITAAAPVVKTLQPYRQELCPRVHWRQVWSDASRYEVVVLLFRPATWPTMQLPVDDGHHTFAARRAISD